MQSHIYKIKPNHIYKIYLYMNKGTLCQHLYFLEKALVILFGDFFYLNNFEEIISFSIMCELKAMVQSSIILT